MEARQGAIRVFLERHLCRQSRGASRHRYPPRDLVNSRTARTVEAASRSDGRTGSLAQRRGKLWKRRAAGGGVGRLQRVHGGIGVCGGIRDTHRCGSLRQHDGRLPRATDSRRCLRSKSAMSVLEEDAFGGSSLERPGAGGPDHPMRDLETPRLQAWPGETRCPSSQRKTDERKRPAGRAGGALRHPSTESFTGPAPASGRPRRAACTSAPPRRPAAFRPPSPWRRRRSSTAWGCCAWRRRPRRRGRACCGT
jgi:hypothetical protein